MASFAPDRAVIAFSFGLRDESQEPNPCNRRLADAAERIIDHEAGDVVLISQWEVAEQLASDGVAVDQVIRPSADDSYLGSEEVWAQAVPLLNEYQITTVIPVAQPFLQMHKVLHIIRESGFTVERRPIGRIGFDSSPANRQWWTKGPVRLFAYALMQAFGRRTPPPAADVGA